MSAPQPERAYWRYGDVAKWLGVPQATVRQLVYQKRIPHVRVNDRLVLFDPGELAAWLETRKVAAK